MTDAHATPTDDADPADGVDHAGPDADPADGVDHAGPDADAADAATATVGAAEPATDLEPLTPMPGIIEAIPVPQMATMVYGHVKEMHGMTYNREKARFDGDPPALLEIASAMLLMCLDDGTMTSVMAEQAAKFGFFDSFAAAREAALNGLA